MRQLYLVNESGTSFFFDYRSSALISNISDLGFSRNNTYLNFENDYVLVDSKVAQASITFKVVFLKGYEGYKEFARFIASSNELRLFYKADGNTKFCYVSFKSISKTELESNCIQSSVVLDKLSLWLVNESHTIVASEGSGGKKFPFSYPTTYASSFIGSVNISNDSAIKEIGRAHV